MSTEPTSLLLVLRSLHLLAVACWMAGQLSLWNRTRGIDVPRGVNRRVVSAATGVAAILSLSTGAGLLAL
jgi:hypothetical protein